jgi:acetyl esterase/lipase
MPEADGTAVASGDAPPLADLVDMAALARFFEEVTARSAAMRAKYRNESNVALGDDPRQILDIYYPDALTVRAPVVVFMHGGGFRNGSPEQFGYMGEALLARGAIFVSIGYRLLDQVDFPELVADVVRGMQWVYENIEARGGDPDRISLAGHSAGAMLAALLGLRTAWLSEYGLPDDFVKGLVLVSGAYNPGDSADVPPELRGWNVCDDIVRIPEHTIVVTGENDLPGMQPDAEALVAALRSRGASVEFISAVPGRDHFYVGHEFADDDGRALVAIQAMLGLE